MSGAPSELQSLDRYWDALYHLVCSAETRPRCVRFDDDEALFLLPGRDEPTLLAFRYRDDTAALVATMKARVAETPGLAEVLLVGGPKTAARLVRKALPFTLRRRFRAVHLSGDGRFKSKGRGAVARAIRDRPPVERAQIAEVREMLDTDVAALGPRWQAEVAFVRVMAGRTPYATFVLSAVITLLFFGSTYVGASGSLAGLINMGALVPDLVGEGEIWRLLSASLLHANLEHWVCNLAVLLGLGGFIERLMGTSRFLVLYVASALGGGLASYAFLGEQIGVGASGALWGLMAAQVILLFVRSDLLPEGLVAKSRSSVAAYLVLNLVVSFMPDIDLAAHLGGGAVGALLMGVGWLTRDLRSAVDEPASEAPRSIRALGIVGAVLLLGCGATAIGVGQAWEGIGPAPSVPHTVHLFETRISVPSNLERVGTVQDGGTMNVLFGRMPREPAGIGLVAYAPDPAGQAQIVDELLENGCPDTIGKFVSVGKPRQSEASGRQFIECGYRFERTLHFERTYAVDGAHVWRVELLTFQSYKEQWRGQAASIARSIERMETAPSVAARHD